MKRLRVLFLVAMASAAILTACKQGRGDRCQIDDDCSRGLICNKATDTCQETSGGGDIDATVPDASPDAPIDAPSDAPIDGPAKP